MAALLESCAEAVLDRFGINYRELTCKNGWFYYCKNFYNGTSFDIKIDDDGTIRLWRFIGSVLLSKTRSRCEYHNSQKPCSVVGMKVTDEGDVSSYAEQKVDVADVKSVARIDRRITRYINMISDVPHVFTLWTIGLWEPL